MHEPLVVKTDAPTCRYCTPSPVSELQWYQLPPMSSGWRFAGPAPRRQAVVELADCELDLLLSAL